MAPCDRGLDMQKMAAFPGIDGCWLTALHSGSLFPKHKKAEACLQGADFLHQMASSNEEMAMQNLAAFPAWMPTAPPKQNQQLPMAFRLAWAWLTMVADEASGWQKPAKTAAAAPPTGRKVSDFSAQSY